MAFHQLPKIFSSVLSLLAATLFILAGLVFRSTSSLEKTDALISYGVYCLIALALYVLLDWFFPHTARRFLANHTQPLDRWLTFDRLWKFCRTFIMKLWTAIKLLYSTLVKLYRSTAGPWPSIFKGRGWQVAVILTAIILFFIPFGWFDNGGGDLGGDSTRLYYLDPLTLLQRRAVFSIGTSGFGFASQNFSMIPFLLLLQGIKIILLNTSSLILPAFNGILLTTAFLSIYGIINHLISLGRQHQRYSAIAYISGLFYILSPILLFSWRRPVYRFYEIATYPLLMWILLQCINRRSQTRLLLGLLVTVLFAINFGYQGIPGVFAAWPLLGVILLAYTISTRSIKFVVRAAIVFGVLYILSNAWHLLPQTMAFLSPNNTLFQNAFTPAGKITRGLNYFTGVSPLVHLTYNLARLPQYWLYSQTANSPDLLELIRQYGLAIMPLLLLYPIIILGGLWLSLRDTNRSRRAWLLLATACFIITLFLMTANIFGTYGPAFYAQLFILPGFAMFRSFYGVFMFIFLFFYTLTFGLAFNYCWNFIRHQILRSALLAIVIIPLIYGAIPFLNGAIANSSMPDTNGVPFAHHWSQDFLDTLAWITQVPLDAKWLTLPLNHFDYQIIEGENGGAYVGPSPINMLTGKNTFSGLGSFDGLPENSLMNSSYILERFNADDTLALNRLFSLLNINFIFYDSSPYIYKPNFHGWPYSQEIWTLFPDSQQFARFASRLGYEPIYERGPYIIYQYRSFFLPHFYTPRKIVKAADPRDFQTYLSTTANYDVLTAFYRDPSRPDAIENGLPDTIEKPPIIEFRKINQVKYRLRIHTSPQNIPLVFSHAFNSGWKLYPVPISESVCDISSLSSANNNQINAATSEDINQACKAGTLSITGPSYISSLTNNNTRQNNNLPAGNLLETWRLTPLSEQNHLLVNEYANSWWLNTDELTRNFPQAVKTTSDGQIHMEFVLEFTPQRFFYYGLIISLLTLTVVALFLIYRGLRYVHDRLKPTP
jgi:hypothetical protein